MDNQLKLNQIAVLITCHNRKTKTLACLTSLHNCSMPADYSYAVFLVDDGCIDGTSDEVKKHFPLVSIIKGDGNLFWAGGMRKAWNAALDLEVFSAFLLLNDDVELEKNCLKYLINTHKFSLSETGKSGIYVGSTAEKINKKISYGGHIITKNHFVMRSYMILPTETPQVCHFANANIMWVSNEVVKQVGIFDNYYSHGIADFDYTLVAYKQKIPLWVTPNICGYCENDHDKNWLSSNASLRLRILFLKSKTGLAYKEYLYYIRKHFILSYPYSFTMLWLKTLFPTLWDLKNKINKTEIEK